MSYQVFALKWRPQRFGDVAGQTHISRTLANALQTGRTAHAYLFTGPRGVGKTSMARILAKAVNCENDLEGGEPCGTCTACLEITQGRALDVIEIDGASNRGIDDIRDLREGVRYAPARLRNKIYIIDEVHMLTQDAFNALLKTLEEPPPHVVFILATTEPLKVPQTILSRCQRFDFARLRARDVVAQLQRILDAEEIEADGDALALVANKGEGSMRDALTLLDQVVATGTRPLTAPAVREILGIAGRELFFEWGEAIRTRDAARALGSLGRAVEEGANLQELADEFLVHLRNLLVASTDKSLEDTIEATDEERARYLEQAESLATADLLRFCRIAIDAVGQMRKSGFPRVHLEVALSEMCSLPSAVELRRFIEVARGKFPESTAGDASAATAAAMETSATQRAVVPASPPPAAASSPAPPSPPAPTPAPAPTSVPPSALPPTRLSTPPSAARPAPDPAPSRSMNASRTPKSKAPESRADAPTDLGAGWTAALELVTKTKPALSGFLVGSEVRTLDGSQLVVAVPGLEAFQADLLQSKSNKTVVSGILEKAFGRPLSVRFEAAPRKSGLTKPNGAAAPPSAGGTSQAGIQRIVDVFDGDVLGPS